MKSTHPKAKKIVRLTFVTFCASKKRKFKSSLIIGWLGKADRTKNINLEISKTAKIRRVPTTYDVVFSFITKR